MKRVWVAIVIVLFVAGLCICEKQITCKAAKEITEFTKSLSEDIALRQIAENSNALAKSWEKKKAYLDIFLNHDTVDKISEQIRAVSSYAQSGCECMLKSEGVRLEEMAQSLTESEEFLIENIL